MARQTSEQHPLPHARRLRATIVLLSQERLRGQVTKFSPRYEQLEITMWTVGGPNATERRLVNVSDIAYLAFPLPPAPWNESPDNGNGLRTYKVHLSRSATFLVRVSPAELTQSGGFGAYPIEPSHGNGFYFFYAHAVRAVERGDVIGQVLLDQGLVQHDDLEEAIEVQADSRQATLGDILLAQDKVSREALEQAVQLQAQRSVRIGTMLEELGYVSSEDIDRALEQQQEQRGRRLGQVLVDMGIISERALMAALAHKFHMPFIDLDEYPVNEEAARHLPPGQIRELHALPIQEDSRAVTVAIADPLATEVHDVLQFFFQRNVKEVLVTESQLDAYIEKLAPLVVDPDMFPDSAEQLLEQMELDEGEDTAQENISADLLKREADAAPIIRLVNQILVEGIQAKASDIHLLPRADGLLMALRLDGTLSDRRVISPRIQRQVTSRLKLMSGMDIAERRLPQDGRVKLLVGGQTIELRVSSIPNVHGESLVLRILYKGDAVSLQALGLKPIDEESLMSLAQRQFGLILVTGPTGSGKSTTLFALLNQMTNKGRHIISVEDPVESEIDGVNHIQVNSRIGLTFARVLRNILRHDPDVIMIGEMRDEETASIGIEAALTGHLLLSTLHTNTAVDTIARLGDMGIPNYLVAPAILAVVSQILARRICVHCRQETTLPGPLERLLKREGLDVSGPFYEGAGCDECGGTGNKGRALVYEYLEANEAVRTAIHQGLTGSALQAVAVQEGMIPKSHYALQLAKKGIISAAELYRALG